MFGSNPFGQSSTSPFGQPSTSPFGQPSTSPFGAPSVFGQTSNTTNNPFAPKPFGSSTTTPFGAPQTGSSIFGGTSTGVFGQPSTPTFGTSSPSPFGTTTPAFGASTSAPTFGSSPSFGSGSLFGQKPAFGGFGSSPSQSSPFGSTFQQTQPAFGSSTFGSTGSAFGGPSTMGFGATTSSSAFGAPSAPAFGAATSSPFGSTTTSAFNSTTSSLFGSTGSAFGGSTAPPFGSTPFGSTGSSIFGSSTTSAFGGSTTPGFTAPGTTNFGFGSTPPSGQTASAFGTTPFGGATSSTFQPSIFGQTNAGQGFGNQGVGTRIAPYTPTPDPDATAGQQIKLDSISAMHVYKDKSHEELRWEDYQRGDKGGPNPSGQPATSFPATQQPNPFGGSPAFGQTNANPFSSPSTNTANPFAPKPAFSTGFPGTSSIFNQNPASSSPFSTSLFSATGASLATSTVPSLFTSTSTNAFSTSPSIFAPSAPSFASTPATNTQSGLFQQSPFGVPPSTGFQLGNSSVSSLFTQNLPSSTGGGSLFSSTTPLFTQTSSPFLTSFQTPASTQTSNLFTNQASNLFPSQAANVFSNQTQQGVVYNHNQNQNQNQNQGIFGQTNPAPSNMFMQPAVASNPFGTLPAMPQMSIGNAGSSPSVQYGISSLPVAEKPLQVRTLSMLVPRHLSQRRIKLPPRRYNPSSDGPKVPFFADNEEAPSTPKADAFFIPRENPRTLVIRPIDQWPPRTTADKQAHSKNGVNLVKNGKASEDPSANQLHAEDHDDSPVERELDSPKENGFDDDHTREEAAPTAHQDGTDVERLMPKLRQPDYYIEPPPEELAAKERAEPGFCRRVKDFVVGRRGYGSIKFSGETDVRALDLESVIEFNNREVIVYKDESNKPPEGEGLNKPAEVTLLNIKCMNRKTGEHYTEGPKVEKYKEMLMKKAEEQGAEFISFDAVKGEWKFKVKHFSSYEFGEGTLDYAAEC